MQQRMTKQKKMILDTALSHHDHPTADQLYIEIRLKDEKISRATVYRVLEQFTNDGALLHVKVPGADRFDSRSDFHYHMICRCCDKVFDVPMQYDSELDKRISLKTGFHIDRHRTIFEGLCNDCLKAANNDYSFSSTEP